MAFDIDQYESKSDEEKVKYLMSVSPEDYSQNGTALVDIPKLFERVQISEDLTKEVYDASLQIHIARPLDYIKQISTAIQKKNANIQTPNAEFTRILSAAMVVGGSSYDKDVAYLFAALGRRLNNTPSLGSGQELFDDFLTTGYLDNAKVA